MAPKETTLTQLPGEPPLEIALRRSRQARRYSLRVSQLDGRVTLTLPTRAPLEDGLAFVREREDWIRGHLQQRPDRRVPALGLCMPYRGGEVTLVPGKGRAPRLNGDTMEVPGRPEQVPRRVENFLKLQARDHLAEACDRYAAALGRPFHKLTLRDTRSRWGSCSSQGHLMFSWRLIMAPAEVLDYVAAHEVAHLAEMNHSAAYWRVLGGLCPDYAMHKDWLRHHGAVLHQWQFRD